MDPKAAGRERIAKRTRAGRSGLVVLVLLGAVTGSMRIAHASHPLITDDAGTQGVSGAEMAISTLVLATPATDTLSRFDIGLGAHLGLLEALDVGLTLVFQAVSTTDWQTGFADPVLDLKWRFFEGSGAWQGLAVRIDYKPPQQSPLSSGGHDVGATLIGSWQKRVEVHANTGTFLHDLGTRAPVPTVLAGVSLLIPIWTNLQTAIEAFGEGTVDHLYAAGATAGLIWEFQPTRRLSAGIGPIYQTGAPFGWTATVGLTAGFAGDQ